jgi:hypothetical protein
LHRDLVEALGRHGAGKAIAPDKLIAPMLARFMSTDHAFVRLRREGERPSCGETPDSMAMAKGSATMATVKQADSTTCQFGPNVSDGRTHRPVAL